ncbi:SEL1-like repeat protein [Janthinobacterium sp. MDT1-19]
MMLYQSFLWFRPSLFLRLLFAASIGLTSCIATAQEKYIDSDELLRRIVNTDLNNGDAATKTRFESDYHELMTRSNAREPLAMHNYGWYRFQFCVAVKNTGISVDSLPMCTQAFADLRALAMNTEYAIVFVVPSAMSILGEMYKDGIGTKASRYLASDWFIRSSQQRSSNGDREGAIRALEEALSLVPDHPAGADLRKKLLK